MPFYPEPGKYRPLALTVDDPNLGLVIRKFGIHIPEQYSPNKKTPMIMHFHGSGGQGSNACQRKWCDISDEDPDGFIVVQVRMQNITIFLISFSLSWKVFSCLVDSLTAKTVERGTSRQQLDPWVQLASYQGIFRVS